MTCSVDYESCLPILEHIDKYYGSVSVKLGLPTWKTTFVTVWLKMFDELLHTVPLGSFANFMFKKKEKVVLTVISEYKYTYM